jgi:calcium binding protein 39
VPVYRASGPLVNLASAENDPQPELVAQLAQEMYSSDMLQLLVSNMWRFEFEVSILSPL